MVGGIQHTFRQQSGNHMCRLVDTIHTVFCLIVIYRYIIIDFGQLELLQYIVWYVV